MENVRQDQCRFPLCYPLLILSTVYILTIGGQDSRRIFLFRTVSPLFVENCCRKIRRDVLGMEVAPPRGPDAMPGSRQVPSQPGRCVPCPAVSASLSGTGTKRDFGARRKRHGPGIPVRRPSRGKIDRDRKPHAKRSAVLFGGKSSVQGELQKFPFLPAFSLTGPSGHHILYAL
jgi:hypothetical protein